MANHVVKQGECLSSIAKSCGLDWEHLWTLAENSELRKKRKNPNILLPGDVVVIPERRLRIEDRPVDQGHTFVKKGESVKLKIRLLAAGKALANETYMLKVGGQNLQGSTDASGLLEQPISHDVTEGELVLDKEKLSLICRSAIWIRSMKSAVFRRDSITSAITVERWMELLVRTPNLLC